MFGFIYKLCIRANQQKVSLVIPNSVVRLMTEITLQFFHNEIFVHGVCRTLYCLISNIINRQQLKIYDCISLLQAMRRQHRNSQIFADYSSKTVARLSFTII